MERHDYWEWFDDQLKQPSRAIGGEPCLICGEPIAKKAHWKFRDRHVCSSKCNEKLKRRWKAKVKRGEAPEYRTSSETVGKIQETLSRRCRLFGTNENASFPYEYGYSPIMGDMLERHGEYTAYVSIKEVDYQGTHVQQVIDQFGFPLENILAAVHVNTGAWRAVFLNDNGTPSRLSTGYVYWNGDAYPEQGLIHVKDAQWRDYLLYCNFEIFRSIDQDGLQYDWEAYSFSLQPIANPLWTPEYKARYGHPQ